VIHLPAAAKNPFLREAFSYSAINRGDGGVGAHPSLLFAHWLRRHFPPIITKRLNSEHNAPAGAETPP
jgi:hypothetical protein